jgi:hypothetical protein
MHAGWGHPELCLMFCFHSNNSNHQSSHSAELSLIGPQMVSKLLDLCTQRKISSSPKLSHPLCPYSHQQVVVGTCDCQLQPEHQGRSALPQRCGIQGQLCHLQIAACRYAWSASDYSKVSSAQCMHTGVFQTCVLGAGPLLPHSFCNRM